ncbi:xyloglucan galactosyltransferase MUR3 [Marchantia polymorpha subsp. ruderalis]|uniref:Exostosin GT47 domain-containing protein n=2 Tax=Marchantia polymorpha TaxID=3197 RepID=A0AAF6BNW2_MARPO|nr:hypothetical protein MARPO_0097s0076 [Marchantia polymorpha]BBN13696.1 hypothetical protein Mp_6g05660 [Marchantia polymorpha subsp. ruderalis]|eukprot:PTQ32614.1 hypothetical protein MARPO_0097s0076 [Marchantia polymorpha]
MLSIHAYVYFSLMGILILLSCWTSLEVQARTQRTRQLRLHSAAESGSKDECEGRRIFMYDLPGEFNVELVQKCRYGVTSWLNFCPHAENGGLGQLHGAWSSNAPSSYQVEQPLEATTGLAPAGGGGAGESGWLGSGWYKTDPYMLEIVFHSRMQKYSCLTSDAARADAFYFPYYVGVDALRYLYNSSIQKDSHGEALVEWIKENAQQEWERHGGKDHFMVLGRTSWDFYLLGNETHTQWGTGLFQLPHLTNMTALIMEKKPWMKHEWAIPYLTSFHPSAAELEAWVARVRASRRSSLFSFAGASRSNIPQSIRNYLLDQCSESGNCTLINCAILKCSHNPEPIMKAFLHSSFCLQPRGDTPTRRSAFDSMIAGCIPVFFHNDSAYSQYMWHLPGEPATYSVFISEHDIRSGLVVEDVLSSFSLEQVLSMRETVISFIPRLIYASNNGEFEDAFEVSVRNVLSRISKLKRGFI